MNAADIRAVTIERVAAYLRERGYGFAPTPAGLAGTWDGHHLWFLLQGSRADVLQVRGRAVSAVPVRDRVAVLRALNDWNRGRVWPKVYLRAEGDQAAEHVLYAELSTDVRHGATDAQLAVQLGTSLVAVTAALEDLAPALGAAPPR